MSARTRIAALALCGLGWGAARAEEPVAQEEAPAAQEGAPAQEEQPSVDEVEYFDQLDTELVKVGTSFVESVVSTTKFAQKAAQAPGVITVISSEEIQARGYRSLAEILRVVPGFYDVYDLVSHNVGIRGINGGARAAGNILKLMINGVRVDFRPTTGNFFGEELVPIALVDRVEIIRGPASALYGADAFLGVINVITKPGKEISGLVVQTEGRAVRTNLGGGGTVVQGDAAEHLDVVVGGRVLHEARSGLSLPVSSPVLLKHPEYADRGPSEADTSRLYSFFVRSKIALGAGTITFQGSIQRLDSAGEFQEFGPLTHGTRITLANQTYGAEFSTRLWDTFTLKLSGVGRAANPGQGGRYDTGEPLEVFLRSGGNEGFSLGAELQGTFFQTLTGTVGLDLDYDFHLVQTFDKLLTQDVIGPNGVPLRKAGTITPGDRKGERKEFLNGGAFVQSLWAWSPDWSAVAGGRLDLHSIYGVVPSGRLGLVYAPVDRPLSIKLLYGSSFKGPSAEQLYGVPLVEGDIKGNEKLGPQTAHTFEAALAYGFPDSLGEVQLNLFATDVLGRVEFLQRGSYLVAENIANELVAGAELYAVYELSKALRMTGSASVARTVARSDHSVVEDPRRVLNPLYPWFQLHGIVDYVLPWAGGVQLSAEASLIGPRSASQSNSALRSGMYFLRPYFSGAVSASLHRKFFGPRTTAINLRVSHILDNHVDSGFAGVDVPSQGLTASLLVTQSIF
jgi:iron complex outermembrane receptor protein